MHLAAHAPFREMLYRNCSRNADRRPEETGLDDFRGWCGRRDLNPHSPCGKTDFLTHLRLSPPPLGFSEVWGLDYPFTFMNEFHGSGAARLVSTPSRPDSTGLGSGSPCYRVPRV